jgi:hypothetical protein
MPSPLLNLAAESGYAEVVKVLLDEASVPVDSLGEFGTSPLFDACYFDNRQDSTQSTTQLLVLSPGAWPRSVAAA